MYTNTESLNNPRDDATVTQLEQLEQLEQLDVQTYAEAIGAVAIEDTATKKSSKPAKAKTDPAVELAKLRTELKAAQNKIAQLEIEKRSALKTIPDCLQKAATLFKGQVFYVADWMADNSGGLYQQHDIIAAINNRTLTVKNGKLSITK